MTTPTMLSLAITTSQQISQIDDDDDDGKTIDDVHDVNCPKCDHKLVEKASNGICHSCNKPFKEGRGRYCNNTECTEGLFSPRKDNPKFQLCLLCLRHIKEFGDEFKKDPMRVKEIHNREKLYFVYNNGKITGPITKDEIISLYVSRKIKDNKMYVMSAGRKQNKKWYKLTFAGGLHSKYDLLGDVKNVNIEIKQNLPYLYKSLIAAVTLRKIKQVEFPLQIPEEEQSLFRVKSQSIILILGRLLAILIVAIISLHIFPSMLIAMCLWFLMTKCIVNVDDINDTTYILIYFLSILVGYCGIFITPIIVVNMMLQETNKWEQIQSWMVAYILWGLISFISSMTFFVTLRWNRYYRTFTDIIWIVVGIDFGDYELPNSNLEVDFSKKTSFIGDNGAIAVLYLIPALAGLLPAIGVGFVANFMLEEKFELQCTDDTVIDNDHLCFDSEYGCCKVISSHDLRDTYAFMGGLASNIIAAWAIIRVCGYLLVKSFPMISLYARRAKY